MKKWWEKPLRAVSLDLCGTDITGIDIKALFEEAHQNHINLVSLPAVGRLPGGSTFYPSKIAQPYPGLGKRDLLAEAIKTSRAHGQKVLAGIATIWGSKEMYLANPDWAQRKGNGDAISLDEQSSAVAFCPNSPYQDYLDSIIREILSTDAPDGILFEDACFESWCNCWYCQKKYYEEFHEQLPTVIDMTEPSSQNFIAWRYKQISQWREVLYKVAKDENRCVVFSGIQLLTRLSKNPTHLSGLEYQDPVQKRFDTDWYAPLAFGVDPKQVSQFEDVQYINLSRRVMREPLWWSGLSLRYASSIAHNKRVLAETKIGLTPFDQYPLPETELSLSLDEILANSGSPFIIRPDDGLSNGGSSGALVAALRKAHDLETYLEERESIKYAALLYSETTLHRFEHLPEHPSHLSCLKGFAKAMGEEKIIYDVITEGDLAEQLWKYKVLVLPNASCLSGKSKRAIRLFFASGGGIVGSYETGMYDELGQRSSTDDFSKLFGLKYTSEIPSFFGFNEYFGLQAEKLPAFDFMKGLPIPTGGIQVEVRADDGQVLAGMITSAGMRPGDEGKNNERASVITYDKKGSGRSIYIAPPIGNRYLEFGLDSYRKLIAEGLKWAAKGSLPLTVQNAPLSLAVTAFWQAKKKRIVIHLVNSIQDEVYRPIVQSPLIQNIVLEVETGKDVDDVQIIGDEKTPEYNLEGKLLSVKVPDFYLSSIIFITLNYG